MGTPKKQFAPFLGKCK